MIIIMTTSKCPYPYCRAPRVTDGSTGGAGAVQMRELVVTADDFGICVERNEGIVEAMLRGVVTSTSLMANGAAVGPAVALLREHGLLDRVGLHLNLTEGRPLTDPARVPALLLGGDAAQPGTELRDGARFRGLVGLTVQLDSGPSPAAELEAEIEAQLDSVTAALGRAPSHVDGHQHVHLLPQVAPVLAAVMARRGIAFTRIQQELVAGKPLCQGCSRVVRRTQAAREAFRAAGIVASDFFVGLGFCGVEYTRQDLVSALRLVPDSRRLTAVELMVHPGRTGAGWDDFNRSETRRAELEVLCDPLLRAELEGYEGFRLVGVRESKALADAATLAAQPMPDRRAAPSPHAILLAVLSPATGNYVSVGRMRALLCDLGWEVVLVAVNKSLTTERLNALVQISKCTCVVGIHALRAGMHLLDCPVPVVLCLGGTDMNVSLPAGGAKAETIRSALKVAAAVVAFSDDTMSAAMDTGLVAEAKAFVIPQAVALPPDESLVPGFSMRRFLGIAARGGSDKLLVLVAGLRQVKDPTFALAAFAEWRAARSLPSTAAAISDVRFAIIGPKLDREVALAVEAAAAELPGVSYHEPVPWADLQRGVLAEADAVVNTSVDEGMSNALLEAMQIGTPVLARRNAGNSAVVEHRVTGLLFDTPAEFVELAEELLASAELGERLATTAAELVSSTYSVQAEREAWREMLLESL